MISRPDYRGTAYLNAEGIVKYGAVFPDSSVPVKSIYPTWEKLQGVPGKVWIYKVDLGELTDVQKGTLLDLIVERTGQHKRVVAAKINQNGLPLLKRLVRTAIPAYRRL